MENNLTFSESPSKKTKGEGVQGSQKFYHGLEYQLSLLILTGVRLLKQGKKFSISTEDTSHGKFDDIVIHDESGTVLSMIQVKHSNDHSNQCTKKSFLNSDDLNLYKYYKTWYNLKDKNEFKNCKIFIFTNRDIDRDQDFLEKTGIENNEFVFENECKTMKFKRDNLTRKDFILKIINDNEEVEKKKEEAEKIKEEAKNKKRSNNQISESKIIKPDNKSNINKTEFLNQINSFLDKLVLMLNQPDNITNFIYNDLEI